MGLNAQKVIFSVLVFISGGLGVLLPWVGIRGDHRERFMVWGDTFSGGILAGAGLVHLLNGGTAKFHALAPQVKFPLAFALAGAGFLLILFIEAVVLADPDPSQSPLHCGSGGASHEIGPHLRTSNRNSVGFILLLVLSIHSVIVGLALGAQTSPSEALIVFIAIIAHKSMAGFALGVSYRRGGHSFRNAVPVAALFSSMAPLGILAGATVETLISTNGRRLFEAIFDSVGAGTFLYIATLDIFRTEFEMAGDRWQKWLLASAGFGIMAILALWL
jgi:zinc transporter 1/2/3